MAADDRTSQDAAVIGDDLVEALGFEPITSDVTEVALLDDLEVADQDDLAGTVVDDIEILEDASPDEESAAPDEIEAAEAEAPEAETAVETEPPESEDEEDGSLFGTPAPESSTTETQADDLHLDDDDAGSDLDADDDLAVDPVIFFNNGIDTDTAPLADVQVGASNLVDDTTADRTDSLDDPAVDGAAVADNLEDVIAADEKASRQPEDDSTPDELIDLDGENIETDPDAAIDLTSLDPAGLDDGAGADADGADADGADADSVEANATDPPVDGEAVSLLESPVSVPGPPALDDRIQLPSVVVDAPGDESTDGTELVAPQSKAEIVTDPRPPKTRKKLRARKSRRVIRHVDPWSVLTFSVLFHLCFFAALLLASVLVWNAALAAGTIENIESFIRELGDYETFEINSDQVFRAAALIAGLLTLASSVLVVLLTVVFNLISDLIGGIRVTVIEEETVRVPTTTEK